MNSSSPMHWSVANPSEWDVVAHDISAMLNAGDILALQGPLGAGKTTFVQALSSVLGAQREPKSPTFSMLRTYPVNHGDIRRLLHVDAYRIEKAEDLLPLDLDEELSMGDAILLLEWPEQVADWLKTRNVRTLTIEIKKEGREASLSSR